MRLLAVVVLVAAIIGASTLAAAGRGVASGNDPNYPNLLARQTEAPTIVGSEKAESTTPQPSAAPLADSVPGLDTRPVRLVGQLDVLYATKAGGKYVTKVGVSPGGSQYTVRSSSSVNSLMAVGDWNRDAKDDLFEIVGKSLVITLSASTSANPGAMGTQYTLPAYNAQTQILDVAAVNWGGGGYYDAVVLVSRSTGYGLDFYPSTGGTPLNTYYTIALPYQVVKIAAGDFNGDGRGDLALLGPHVTQPFQFQIVELMLSLSASGAYFAHNYPAYAYSVASYITSISDIEMGDWDKDGFSDIAIIGADTMYHLDLILGHGACTSCPTGPVVNVWTRAMGTYLILRYGLGDWNADGMDDLIFVAQQLNAGYEIHVLYSASTGPGDVHVGNEVVLYNLGSAPPLFFTVGDWNGDSTFAKWDGVTTGTRELPVPVGLLMPPPFLTSVADVSQAYAFYGTGTTDTQTYDEQQEISAGIGISIGADYKVCVLVCEAGIEAKLEAGLEASIVVQTGFEETLVSSIGLEVTGDRFLNTETGQYEPQVVVAYVAYLDYKFDIFNQKPQTQLRVPSFVINVPNPAGSHRELVYLSNWNNDNKRPKDLPQLANIRTGGDISTYFEDSTYTSSPMATSGTGFSQYAKSDYVSTTLKEGITSGFVGEQRFNMRGEVTAMAGGITAGFYGTTSLAKGYMLTSNRGTEITIGGRAPRLSALTTDGGLQYEIYAYSYNAYVSMYTYNLNGVYFTCLVQDWKVSGLHEGYPAVVSALTASPTALTVSWLPAGGDDRRTAYYVHFSTNANLDPDYQSPPISPGATSYDLIGLSPGVYWVRVQATFSSSIGFTSYSAAKSCNYAGSYALTISVSQPPSAPVGGTTSPPPGTQYYSAGETATVTANPYSGYQFDHWTLDSAINTANPISVTMNSAHTLVAFFRPLLTITATTGGSTNPAVGSTPYDYWTIVYVTATANTGYVFDHWMVDGTSSLSNPVQVTMNIPHRLDAYFRQAWQLWIQVPTGGTTNPYPGWYYYSPGTVVTITSMAYQGWVFDHWTLDGATRTGASISVTMNADHTVVALFRQTQYRLDIYSNPYGGSSPNPGTYYYAPGSVVTVTALPNSGYVFDFWNLDYTTSTSNPISLTMNADHWLTPNFKAGPGSFTLTITVSGTGNTNPGAGTYTYPRSTPVTIYESTADPCYFLYFTVDGVRSADDPVTVVMDANHAVNARFKCPTGGCVAEGTEITMADGSLKTVERIGVGDQIRGYDPETKAWVTETVLTTTKTKLDGILSINEGALRVTLTDQPIYVRHDGFEGWVRDPQDIKVGWQVFDASAQSWIDVTSTEYVAGKVWVYDFLTDGPRTYLANSILVMDKIGA